MFIATAISQVYFKNVDLIATYNIVLVTTWKVCDIPEELHSLQRLQLLHVEEERPVLTLLFLKAYR